jgi:poly(hydroxyalkanoate) depolymerase family esterase
MNLRETIQGLVRQRTLWKKYLHEGVARGAHAPPTDSWNSALAEVRDFGSNPGNLRMFTFAPPRLAPSSALVVVLHGCTQTAASYDFGAGWSTLASRYGFALLLPQQQPANNPKNCFSWFQRHDATRGQGEALSIKQMIEKAIIDLAVDTSRVFVTGLSAGGAMTSVMLAAYPEVFAAGAIVAGVPYGSATNVQEAFESMLQGRSRSATEWSDLVRTASPHQGPWPKVSVWHGSADTIVKPSNADEIIKQWTPLHGVALAPTKQDSVNGYPRRVWCSPTGEELIELYSITGMAHGTPLATGDEEDRCGTAGAFLLDVGVSSSFQIARFWGLTAHRGSAVVQPIALPPLSREPVRSGENVVLLPDPVPARRPDERGAPNSLSVQAVIVNALKAAGLMK